LIIQHHDCFYSFNSIFTAIKLINTIIAHKDAHKYTLLRYVNDTSLTHLLKSEATAHIISTMAAKSKLFSALSALYKYISTIIQSQSTKRIPIYTCQEDLRP